jgi:hypothetical protein
MTLKIVLQKRLYTMNKKEKPKLYSKNFQKEWSEKHKYKHIHTGEYCTFESYVAELLILRKADAFKESKPAYKFWSKGEKLYPAFVRQVKAVIKLKKKFSEEIILGAINSKHFEKVFYIGLYAKNYVGWKMNPLALEAIECYYKETEERSRLQQTLKEANEKNIETKTTAVPTRRSSSYNKNKGSLNQLRKL